MNGYLTGEPKVEGPVTVTKVGADFCVSFSNPPSTLQILCNDANPLGTVPTPTLSWYKDDVLAITMDEFGGQVVNEDFYNVGNNGLFRFGVLDPPPLVALSTSPGSGQLFLNFVSSNVSQPDLLPPGVDPGDIDQELFAILLGSWECRVNNTFGEDSASTDLSDCGKSRH